MDKYKRKKKSFTLEEGNVSIKVKYNNQGPKCKKTHICLKVLQVKVCVCVCMGGGRDASVY